MRILGLIPARGGSKGIPRKNIMDVGGKPLINYSIEAGLEAIARGDIDRLIVSTDDEEIAEIARTAGADVPFLRPAEYAKDQAKSVDVMIHAYEYCRESGEEYDAILLLQPTSPLRTAEDIHNAIEIYQNSEAKSLISVCKEENFSEYVAYHKKGSMAQPLSNLHNKGIRRQEVEDIYIRNGAVYITDIQYMLENHFVISDMPAMYEMPKERSTNIDTIDDVEELKWRLSEKK